MKELMWIRIETNKSNDDLWSLKGQILKSDFERIVSNEMTSGYFRLERVYWISSALDEYGDNQEEKLYEYGKDNFKAYSGDLYLKAEHLISIAPIDGEMELERFRKTEEKPLSLVSPIR